MKLKNIKDICIIIIESVETAMVYRSNDIYLSHPPNYIRMNIQSDLTL